MTTASSHPVRGARRRIARIAVLATVTAGLLLSGSTVYRNDAGSTAAHDDLSRLLDAYEETEQLEELVEHEGRVPTNQLRRRDAVEAAFARESYRPGSPARLVVSTHTTRLTAQILRVGVESFETKRNDVMNGVPVSGVRRLGGGRSGRVVWLRIGDWPSGLYVAKLTAGGGRTGFAPFVVRPERLGTHRVAVVLPTYTWQAYNFRDDDGNGSSDTWYAGWRGETARINRPYLDRGVPPHFRVYDLPFLRWLHKAGREVDVLTDSDLDAERSGAKLARYELLVFPGHHEYVTRREYDAVTDYRNRGGNLMFLSANNFFWRVDRRGNVLKRVKQWRDLGRPEAALIGVQYIANDRGTHRGAWIVRKSAARVPWLFAGTGADVGGRFSEGGIEIDAISPASPNALAVVAEIPRLFGPRYTGQMTYYETRAGAKVFAAGAFTLAGAVRQKPVQRLLSNLLARLAADGDAGGALGAH
jgi:hypothetical protein